MLDVEQLMLLPTFVGRTLPADTIQMPMKEFVCVVIAPGKGITLARRYSGKRPQERQWRLLLALIRPNVDVHNLCILLAVVGNHRKPLTRARDPEDYFHRKLDAAHRR